MKIDLDYTELDEQYIQEFYGDLIMEKEHEKFWNKLVKLYRDNILYLYNHQKKRNEYIWNLRIKDGWFLLGLNEAFHIKFLHCPSHDKKERSAIKFEINDETIAYFKYNIKISKKYTVSLFEDELIYSILSRDEE